MSSDAVLIQQLLQLVQQQAQQNEQLAHQNEHLAQRITQQAQRIEHLAQLIEQQRQATSLLLQGYARSLANVIQRQNELPSKAELAELQDSLTEFEILFSEHMNSSSNG